MSLDPRFIKHQQEIERQIHRVCRPHAGQVDVATAFFIHWMTGVFVQCGRKWGKTDIAIYCMYMFGKLFEGAECYYIADEKDHARKILWENGRLPRFFSSVKRAPWESHDDFKRRKEAGMILQHDWVVNTNSSEMTVKLDNDSMLMVDGAKNFAKADGLSPTLIVYDEFKNHDSRFDLAMRPNMQTFKGRILIVGTPPDNTENYYCETAEEFKMREDHLWLRRPSYMNPYVYDGPKDPNLMAEKEVYKMKKSSHIFEREYMAKIVPDEEKMIFPHIDKVAHVMDYDVMKKVILSSRKDWDFYISFDPASTTVFAALLTAINKYDKRVWDLDEIYETDIREMRAKNIWVVARTKWREIWSYDDDWEKIYDYAAAWFNTEIAAEFDEAVNPCTKDMKKKENKLSVMSDIIYSNRYRASSRCTNTMSEIINCKKDDKGKLVDGNDHNLDNKRYILNANHYSSCPKEAYNADTNSGRRFHTPDSDNNGNDLNNLEKYLGGDYGDDYL